MSTKSVQGCLLIAYLSVHLILIIKSKNQILPMEFRESYHSIPRAELKPFLPKNIKAVLEIGCGSGAFSQLVENSGEYWGVEPEENAAREASQVLFKSLHGTYEDVCNDIPDNYFDLIVCNDVIEHMPDHEDFLHNVKSKLTTHGQLVGSVPNVRYVSHLMEVLFEKDWRYRDAGTLDRTHLRFFTEKSLQAIFNNCDYNIETMEGVNPAFKKANITKIFSRILRKKYWLYLLLGKDSNFLQYGFRIKPK